MPSVIVIGAGLSGLYAAKVLKESATQDINVTVLEARDRVGGRTLTVKDDTVSATVDLGGAYVGKPHKLLLNLAKELGVETYKVYGEGNIAIHTKDLGHKFTSFSGLTWNPIKIIDILHFFWLIDKLSQQLPLDKPWEAPKAKEWDQTTFLTFLEKNTWTKTARSIVQTVMPTLLCCELHQVSLLFVLSGIRSGGGLMGMLEVEGGLQESKFVGGSQQLSQKLAQKLQVDLLYGQHVVKIDDQPGQQVKVTTLEGRTLEADYVITAIPATLFGNIVYNPPLPGPWMQLLQRMPQGSVIKAFTFYQEPFWKQKGLSGGTMTDYGPSHASLDDSQPDGSASALLSLFVATKATELSQLSMEERKEMQAQHYAKVFRDERYLQPVHYVDQDWTSEQYTRGGYGPFAPVGTITQFKNIMRDAHGRVLFAGSDLSSVWNGYMEGALLTGEAAAIQVLKKLDLCPGSMKESTMSSTMREMEKCVTQTSGVGCISVGHLIIAGLVLIVVPAAAVVIGLLAS